MQYAVHSAKCALSSALCAVICVQCKVCNAPCAVHLANKYHKYAILAHAPPLRPGPLWRIVIIIIIALYSHIYHDHFDDYDDQGLILVILIRIAFHELQSFDCAAGNWLGFTAVAAAVHMLLGIGWVLMSFQPGYAFDQHDQHLKMIVMTVIQESRRVP